MELSLSKGIRASLCNLSVTAGRIHKTLLVRGPHLSTNDE